MDLNDVKDSALNLISSDWQQDIKNRAENEPLLRIIRPHMFAPPKDRDKFGPTMSPEDALNLVEEATDCQSQKQNEAGWNMVVHYLLLSKAIYGSRRRLNRFMGVTPCTTAKIIKEYLSATTQAKMVDFCIYLDPKNDPATLKATENARSILPCSYLNHTDYHALRKRPIALSIETKASESTSAGSAELQIGSWHGAQWCFLEDLVTRNGGSLDELPFLPAIVMRGHDWSLAATTREGQRTILWLPSKFASTENTVGVYKAVLGVQQLCRWIDDVFWPWYKKNALGMSGS